MSKHEAQHSIKNFKQRFTPVKVQSQ